MLLCKVCFARPVSDWFVWCCSYALRVPKNLDLAGCAPLLCAGITTYSPLMYYGLNKPGELLRINVSWVAPLGGGSGGCTTPAFMIQIVSAACHLLSKPGRPTCFIIVLTRACDMCQSQAWLACKHGVQARLVLFAGSQPASRHASCAGTGSLV